MPINPEQPSTWVAIHDGRLCPDCRALAGKTMTIGEWIASGTLPGNGQTVCGDWCRCMIVPVEWAADFGDPPIVDVGVKAVANLREMPADLIPTNVKDRWGVMQEAEPGFAPDVETDIAKTVEYYNRDPEGLMLNFPKHYQLIRYLLDL